MPDFIRLKVQVDDHSTKEVVIVTSMIAAVVPYTETHTRLLVQGVWLNAYASAEMVYELIGVPLKRMVMDERDRPVAELLDKELMIAWHQWCERKNRHAFPDAVMIEAELRRRNLTVGSIRE